ncbi:metal-binding protein ZinT [Tianweitania sp. BSSL-BM11]|uniref:Metal-binding protein ZinT n=1 Tax=Tianweitania aestuarii TaxID=2814886 RepID=A0ABS5RVL8_9HYPH|nr:metal-binding protein ZinT [Tianweitania aestuarii]MBS9721054.1 metal-binding protein ZinT [Tianweitania aestuarii]
MNHPLVRRAAALALSSTLLFTGAVFAADSGSASSNDHGHEHAQGHHHHPQTEEEKKISSGYFEDDQVKERPLSNWEGHWQSVYPYMTDGTLDPVMEKKAKTGDKTAAEYKAYYETGYKTDVDWISIEGNDVTFYKQRQPSKATYESDGFEILTYEKGNRGVRYIFKKTSGDDAAPDYFQFSDHTIAPRKAGHFHLYFGDDRAALLEEVTNWPTYYPFAMNKDQIVEEMLAH